MDSPDSTAPRRRAPILLVLLLPALTLVAAEHGHAARGPFYFGANQDPSYTYLLGALRVSVQGKTGFFHHPGLTTQRIGATVLAATHAAAGRQDDYIHDVLTRPEVYLRAMQLAILAAVLAALTAVGFVVWRGGHRVAALMLQASPFLGAVNLESLSQVGAEATVMLAAAALSLAVWRFATVAPGDERIFAVAFGAITAFALTTRVSALVFLVVPPLLLRTWRGRFLFAGTAAACGGLAVLLLIELRWKFVATVLYHARRTGAYGSKQKSLLDPTLYGEGVATLYQRHFALFAVMGLAAALWLWYWRSRRGADAGGLYHRALGAVLLGQAAQVLIVSKAPTGRYLVPATAVIALDLALVWALTAGAGGRRRGWRRIAAATLLLALPLALEWPRHRAELYRLSRGVANQRSIAAEIAELPADCTVAEFFRASSLPWALHFGQRLSPTAAGMILAELYPGEIFYNPWGRHFESFTGLIPAAEVEEEHSCLALHGRFLPELEPLLIRRTHEESLYAVPSIDAVVAPEAVP